jgi:preprotein translocase subunit SecG
MFYYLAWSLEIAILLLGIFMIGLILLQRGKGGGLSGAFGGIGGSSAFGSRAGDAFTRLTIYVATIWILLIMIEIRLVQPDINAAERPVAIDTTTPITPKKPAEDDKELDKEKPAEGDKGKKDQPPPKDQPVPAEKDKAGK